jgi:hypothetical protein
VILLEPHGVGTKYTAIASHGDHVSAGRKSKALGLIAAIGFAATFFFKVNLAAYASRMTLGRSG